MTEFVVKGPSSSPAEGQRDTMARARIVTPTTQMRKPRADMPWIVDSSCRSGESGIVSAKKKMISALDLGSVPLSVRSRRSDIVATRTTRANWPV